MSGELLRTAKRYAASHSAVERAAKRYAAARQQLQQERDRLRAEVEIAAASGMPETELARVAGVDRMTIRSWLGK